MTGGVTLAAITAMLRLPRRLPDARVGVTRFPSCCHAAPSPLNVSCKAAAVSTQLHKMGQSKAKGPAFRLVSEGP
jgi:hypothetical protein